MSATCPLCGSSVKDELGPVLFGDDQLPLACSIIEGLGVPIIKVTEAYFDVTLDGVVQDGVVAFDRPSGKIWRYIKPFSIRDGKPIIEVLIGEVGVSAK